MNLKIGQNASFSKTISEYDVYGYAGIIGDFNPVHVNQMVAEKGMFHDRVAHGMMVGGLISTVLGTKLPGAGTVYLEQNLKFRKPVYFGDTCTATAIVSKIIDEEKGIYSFDTIITNQDGEIVTEGNAVVMYKGGNEND